MDVGDAGRSPNIGNCVGIEPTWSKKIKPGFRVVELLENIFCRITTAKSNEKLVAMFQADETSVLSCPVVEAVLKCFSSS